MAKARKPVVSPRTSNTGAVVTRGDELRVSVDWLQFSVEGKRVEEVVRVLQSYVDGEWTAVDRGGLGYRRQLIGPRAARLLHDEGRPELHVICPAEWCKALDEAGMRGLLLYVRSVGRASRLDLAGDDAAKRVVPADVREALLRGEQVTRTSVRSFTESLGSDGGSTVTVGRRGSRVFLRVYDKEAESSGKLVATRWELELRDEAAQLALSELVHAPWGPLWAALVVGHVDFRERWRDFNVTRCPRSEWFAQLVDGARKWLAYPPAKPRGVDDVREWLRKQVAAALATVVVAEGGDVGWLHELVRDGVKRMTSTHRRMAADALYAAAA